MAKTYHVLVNKFTMYASGTHEMTLVNEEFDALATAERIVRKSFARYFGADDLTGPRIDPHRPQARIMSGRDGRGNKFIVRATILEIENN